MNISQIIKQNDFKFKKGLGQNFIFDSNFLNAVVSDSDITKEDEVLEIGAGAGTLTYVLSQRCKKVVSVEIDKNLQPLLEEVLSESTNVEILYEDFLSLSADEINRRFAGKFKVVANLPYYITSPIIFKLIEEEFNVESISVMVQKEVAERLIAKEGTKDYGGMTSQINSIADVKILRQVSRKLFFPEPNVDSAVVQISLNRNKYDIENLKCHRQVIETAFSMRRKTLTNCLKSKLNLSQTQVEEIFQKIGLDIKIRGEALSVRQFVQLSNEINRILN